MALRFGWCGALCALLGCSHSGPLGPAAVASPSSRSAGFASANLRDSGSSAPAVVDGVPWIAFPDAHHFQRADGSTGVSFVVYAEPERWDTVTVERTLPYREIAAEAERLMEGGAGPLRIEGHFRDVRFSNGDASDRASRSEEIAEAEGIIMGYWAGEAAGDPLLPDARLHLHVVLAGVAQAGHLQDVVILPEARFSTSREL